MKRLMILVLAALVICTACNREEKKVVLDNSLRVLVKFNGKFGYCDRGGTTVIPPQFDSASIFSEDLRRSMSTARTASSIPTEKW